MGACYQSVWIAGSLLLRFFQYILFMLLLTPFFVFFSDTMVVKKVDTVCYNEIKDKWIAEDKFWHFGMSVALVGSSYHLFKCRLNEEKNRSTIFSLGGTFSLGIMKEFWDRSRPKGHFSYRDIVVNLLGIGVGYLIFIYD